PRAGQFAAGPARLFRRPYLPAPGRGGVVPYALGTGRQGGRAAIALVRSAGCQRQASDQPRACRPLARRFRIWADPALAHAADALERLAGQLPTRSLRQEVTLPPTRMARSLCNFG